MKKLCVLLLVLVLSMSVVADFFNPCDNLDELSAPGFAAGDVGIESGGPSGNFFQFIPRSTNAHLASWDFTDAVVTPDDIFTFDVRNVVALGTATLNGRVILSTGAIHSFTVNLQTDNWQSITVNMPATTVTVTRIDFAITENTKIIQLDNLSLRTNHPGDVDKGPFHNPCVILEELSAPGFAGGDVGIAPAGGPDGSDCFQFVPRSTNTHVARWDFADVTVNPGDTFSFDIKNIVALGTAHVDVRYIVDNGSGGETIIGAISGITLSTNNWVHITLNMPATTKILKRIDWSVTENTKVIQLDNLELVSGDPLDIGLYEYGTIYNPCDDTNEFTFDEGGIASELNGKHVYFVSRSTNGHSLSWNIADINVTPEDFIAFDVKNEMPLGQATLTVNLFWTDSLGHTGVTGPNITGLTDGHLIDSAGWKHCRMPMPPFPCTITNIVFGITENVKVVTLDNLAISPTFLPQNCSQVQEFGLGYAADINCDCYVDPLDLDILNNQWLSTTSPNSSVEVSAPDLYVPTNKIVRGTASVDGDISEWNGNVEWIPLDQVYYGDPNDVTEAKMSLRWNEETGKIYAVVVITDTRHNFEDSYVYWDASDRIEIYTQGSAQGGEYSTGTCDVAQQYTVAPNKTGGFWASWANGYALLGFPSPEFEYAVSIDGDDIIYEVGVKQFDNYSGRPGSSGDTVYTDMYVNGLVRFDVVASTKRGSLSTDFGMLAANDDVNKFANADTFQRYTLVEEADCGALGYMFSDINRDCQVDIIDFSELAVKWLECNDPADSNCN